MVQFSSHIKAVFGKTIKSIFLLSAVRDFSRRATYYYDYEASSTYRWNYFPVRNTTFRYEALINDTEKVYIDGIVNTDIQLQVNAHYN